jgi:hypothetical protein
VSLPFAVEQRLSREHLAAFRELILSGPITIDAATAWLKEYGYKVSHGALGNWMRHARAQSLFPIRPLAGLGNDAETRQQLALWAERLAGDELSNLALFAVYLLSIRAARRGVRLTEIPGTIPMRSRGDRPAK